MTNKIDNSLPLAGRVTGAGAEVGRAGTGRSRPMEGAEPAAPVRLNTDTAVMHMMSAPSAEEPVLDQAKIQAVRHALEMGTYRIDPQKIAARLTALERELSQ